LTRSFTHPFFRASYPNFEGLVNPGGDVVRHLRGFPKWYILENILYGILETSTPGFTRSSKFEYYALRTIEGKLFHNKYKK
jgi:hypothetical protein